MPPPMLLDEPETQTAAPAEADLLARYAAGDEAAFDDLVHLHEEAAFWTARRLVRDDDSAHDVVQDAFIRVLQHRDSYDTSRPFRTWFLRIVRNLAIDHLRRRRHERDEDQVGPVVRSHAGDDLDRSEIRRCIAEVMETLPDKYHDLLVLREAQGMRADRIAERIGVDYATTRWRIHQARKLFRREWTSRYGDSID